MDRRHTDRSRLLRGRDLRDAEAWLAEGEAFSPGGDTLATGSGNGAIQLWNVANPAHPVSLGPPLAGSGPVFAVAFSPDGDTLATGSGHGTIRLWNLAAPAHPVPIGQPLTGDTSYINSVAFSPDGDTLASGSGDGTVRLWNMNVDDAIERICTTAGDLTPQQW